MIENFTAFAMKAYDRPNVTIEEFKRDCDKFLYLNKLFHRYYVNGDLCARLMLNHTITLYNVFHRDACTRMMFYKIKQPYWSGLKTILTYLNFMPDSIEGINSSDIPIDTKIAEELRLI